MKIKLLTLFACLCFELQGLTASQYYLGVTYDGITYLVDEAKKTAMVGHTDCKGDIVIPSMISTIKNNRNIYYCVTSILSTAFQDSKELTTVTIPTSVTNIEEGAFDGCI